MNLITLPNGEQNAVYAQVRAENSVRYLHFLTTLMKAALAIGQPLLTEWRIKAINYHATVMLHTEAASIARSLSICNAISRPVGKKCRG